MEVFHKDLHAPTTVKLHTLRENQRIWHVGRCWQAEDAVAKEAEILFQPQALKTAPTADELSLFLIIKVEEKTHNSVLLKMLDPFLRLYY